MKTFILLVLLSTGMAVHADTSPLSFEINVEKSDHVVDASIESFTGDGFANLKIHSVLKGKNAPAIAKWLHQCVVKTMKESAEKDSRWIFCLSPNGDTVNAIYKIRTTKEGALECGIFEVEKHQIVWSPLETTQKRIADNAKKRTSK